MRRFLLALLLVSLSTRASYARDDVAPSMSIYSQNGISLSLGGLLQLQLAPYVGNQSLVTNQDPATRAGFRMRRARVGFEAKVQPDVRVYVELNPLESDPDVGTIAEAFVSVAPRRWLRFEVGADDVPFTRGELLSARNLTSIERPLSIRTFVPVRRLGGLVSGSVLGDALSYVAGVMNGTEGFSQGNKYGGLLYVGRVQYAIVGTWPARGRAAVVISGGGYYQHGPAASVEAASADIALAVANAGLLIEGLCDRSRPLDSPNIPTPLPDTITRCGAYAETTYDLPWWHLQPAARVEYFDDNTNVKDAGDALLVGVGVNASLRRQTRLQLHYLGRFERQSGQRDNDSVVLSIQGEF
jgi:hypothetical protein